MLKNTNKSIYNSNIKFTKDIYTMQVKYFTTEMTDKRIQKIIQLEYYINIKDPSLQRLICYTKVVTLHLITICYPVCTFKYS